MGKKTKAEKPIKLIVFDFDETIGAFAALSGFIHSLQPYMYNYSLLNQVLRTNPAYIRPLIMDILAQVNEAKKHYPLKVILYTNNSNSEWVSMVLYYINSELKLTAPLFDHVLDASKRNTYDKTVLDLLQRSNLMQHYDNHRIFFVDDQYHPGMLQKNVVYFHISPYKEPNKRDVQASHQLYQELRKFINS